jgi:hypothetical protein
VTDESWRCPLCNMLADDARQHLADVHGVGSGPDRFGLRKAAPPGQSAPRRGPRPLPPDTDDGPDGAAPSADDEAIIPPLTWRRAERPRERPLSIDGVVDGSGFPGRPARLPRRRAGGAREPGELPPAKPDPLPPEAAVLRLIVDTLDGVDASKLHDRLVALPAVESATMDLYARTIDLFIDRTRATPRHLVAQVAGRLRLPVRRAELHRSAPRGEPLGDETRIYIVE